MSKTYVVVKSSACFIHTPKMPTLEWPNAKMVEIDEITYVLDFDPTLSVCKSCRIRPLDGRYWCCDNEKIPVSSIKNPDIGYF